LFFVEFLFLALVLYIAGRIVVGGKRTLFSDAFLIALVGTILSGVFMVFIPYSLLALLLSVFVWLLLIKRLYETGWLDAIAVGVLALIVFLVVLVLIALLFGILHLIFEWLFAPGALMLLSEVSNWTVKENAQISWVWLFSSCCFWHPLRTLLSSPF